MSATNRSQPLLVEVSGPVMGLMLNRPEKLNALDLETIDAIAAAQAAAAADPGVRVITIMGAGRGFSAGADLDHVESMYRDWARARRYLYSLRDMVIGFEQLPQPVVAGVHGFVLAGGLELMMGCDIVVAASSTRIGDQHLNFGFVPGGGGSQRLPRRVGLMAALDTVLTGRWLSAEEALGLGLVSRVVGDDDLAAAVATLAADLAKKSPEALRVAKRLVRDGIERPLQDALEHEIHAVRDHYLAEDFQIGLDAFHSRTEPVFPDRSVGGGDPG